MHLMLVFVEEHVQLLLFQQELIFFAFDYFCNFACLFHFFFLSTLEGVIYDMLQRPLLDPPSPRPPDKKR